VITLAIFVGTAVAIYLKETTNLLVYTTHWIGIGIAVIISKVFIELYFRDKTKGRKAISGTKIKVPVMLYHNYQYFFYGIFIYVFIFVDRILHGRRASMVTFRFWFILKKIMNWGWI
jgi:hypothetical protein